MFPARVVEAVDVFEEGDFDLAAGLPVAAPDQFGLQRLEEAFDCGIVVTVAFPTHRHLEPVLAQQHDSRERSIATRDPCGEYSPAAAFGSRWPCSAPARQDPASCGC